MENMAAEQTANPLPGKKAGWRERVLPRLMAFVLHLVLSCMVFSIVTGILAWLFYPKPFYQIDGFWLGVRITAAACLMVFPLLTLAVFRRGKPGLKFDLSCIVLVQLAVLGYGSFTVYQQRPYFVVYAVEKFYTVRLSDIIDHDRSLADLQALHAMATTGPAWVAVPPPVSPEARLAEVVAQLTAQLSGKGRTVQHQAQQYVPLDRKVWPAVLENRLNAEQIKKAGLQEMLARFAAEHQKKPDELAVFALEGRFEQAWVVFAKSDGALLGYLS